MQAELDKGDWPAWATTCTVDVRRDTSAAAREQSRRQAGRNNLMVQPRGHAKEHGTGSPRELAVFRLPRWPLQDLHILFLWSMTSNLHLIWFSCIPVQFGPVTYPACAALVTRPATADRRMESSLAWDISDSVDVC